MQSAFPPKILELLTETQLKRHPLLSRLGPDLLAEDFEPDQALERLRCS